ncbi:MAG: 23S rRNA (pseudouridine(1915)-N(3))-methyltransferase RlmH [Bacteroidota bacterium]
MKIEFWYIGKTNEAYLREGMQIYENRLKHYLPYQSVMIPDLKKTKNLTSQQIKQKEGEALLNKINADDFLVLLDEKGKSYTSETFATFIERSLLRFNKRIIFQVGGAFGFSEAIYQRANAKIQLSSMTFSHQMVRLFFLEQLYRGMTILKNEPYHNS